MLVLVSIPLAARVAPIADDWARTHAWQVADVTARAGTVFVVAAGLPPDPQAADLRTALDQAGFTGAGLVLRLVLGGSVECPAGGPQCTAAPGDAE